MSDQNAEDDESRDPGVLLVGMDDGKAEDGDHVADDCDDHTPNCNTHGVVRHGRQDLTNDDDVHHRKTTADDHVEDRAELRAVETEGVPRSSNGTETKLKTLVLQLPS